MAAMLDQSLDAMIKDAAKATPKRRNAKKSANVKVGGKKNARSAMKKTNAGPTPMAVGGVKKTKNNKKKPARSNAATAMAVDGMMRGGGGRQANAQAGGRTKLVVGNLDFKVNDRDIKELFGQVGRVLNAGINYGPNGKSKGTAEVTLATLESALKAVKTYNGVKLDGRPLNIVIVDAPQQPKQKPITQRLSGLKQQPKNKNGKQQQKKAPVPAPKRGKATQKVVASAKKAAPKKKPARKPKEKKAAPTAADLDASLDAYKASADVQMAA